MSLRYGIVSEVDYSTGKARVNFDEIGIVSFWLGMPKNIKQNMNLPINSQVAVIMHPNGEDGEILHEVSNDNQLNTWANEDIEGCEFKDGTKVTYNSVEKKLTIDLLSGEIILNCTKLIVNGMISATGNISTSMAVTAVGEVSAASLAVTGAVVAGADISAAGKTLGAHIHNVTVATLGTPTPTTSATE